MQEIIPLSPIDHVFTGIGSYPIEFVFSYKGKIDEARLLESLKKVLKYFAPVSSKLVKISEKAYGFDCSSDAYYFEVTASDLNFSETEKRTIFIDPVDTVEGEPLIKIRLTHTPEGTVLGVSISHAVADGFSYFYFLTSWAKVFHGKAIFPPSHQRDLLIENSGMVGKPITNVDVLRGSGLFLASKRAAIPREHLAWETVNLNQAQLKSLLEETQAECNARLSFNDVVTAMLWKEYIPKWAHAGGQVSTFMSCPVDFRRLLEGFPQNYFGNAVVLATTEMAYDDLLSSSMSDLALKIRDKVASVDRKYINGSMDILDQLQKHSGIDVNEYIHVAHPSEGMLVTNLSRLPVPEVAFNAGPPISYEILTPAQRGAVILPSADGIEIRVCCPVDFN